VAGLVLLFLSGHVWLCRWRFVSVDGRKGCIYNTPNFVNLKHHHWRSDQQGNRKGCPYIPKSGAKNGKKFSFFSHC
jgi:hypothetical protein